MIPYCVESNLLKNSVREKTNKHYFIRGKEKSTEKVTFRLNFRAVQIFCEDRSKFVL